MWSNLWQNQTSPFVEENPEAFDLDWALTVASFSQLV